ncbi:hypothetical protein CASFOL_013164 [Castilleja foliolosa]|uniref:Uncharacterized protein n=1 Tax=Castilleja foliolosa TaxID=1961234 RepID=A0ABD3DMT7_9LAMI
MAEAEKNEKEAENAIAQIGKELVLYYAHRPSTIVLNVPLTLSFVQQAESAFTQLKQSESLKLPVKPMSDSLIKHGLFDHKDRDIRVLVGSCLCEIIRVLAPDPEFSLAVSRDISKFLLSMFGELGDIASPFFSKRAKILETVAKLGFCLTMLDTGCEDLVIKMFKSFFGVVRGKLHLLAAVGISILDSLNINNTPGPHTHRLVLLPSSLYKSGPSEMREASAYPLIGCKADASFTKKLVSCLKFEVSGIVQTGTKHSQQYENSLRPSSARPRISNPKSGDSDNLSGNKTKEHIVELPTGQKEDNSAMSSHIGSAVLTKCPAEKKHERDAHEEPTSSQNEVTESCSRGDDTVNECGSSCAGPSKLSREDNQVKCFTSKGTEIIETNGETLVGKRIKLWSPIEKCYNSGVVDSFDITKSTHQIVYETREVDTLSLDSETWEIGTLDSISKTYINQEPKCKTKWSNPSSLLQNYIKSLSLEKEGTNSKSRNNNNIPSPTKTDPGVNTFMNSLENMDFRAADDDHMVQDYEFDEVPDFNFQYDDDDQSFDTFMDDTPKEVRLEGDDKLCFDEELPFDEQYEVKKEVMKAW